MFMNTIEIVQYHRHNNYVYVVWNDNFLQYIPTRQVLDAPQLVYEVASYNNMFCILVSFGAIPPISMVIASWYSRLIELAI